MMPHEPGSILNLLQKYSLFLLSHSCERGADCSAPLLGLFRDCSNVFYASSAWAEVVRWAKTALTVTSASGMVNSVVYMIVQL